MSKLVITTWLWGDKYGTEDVEKLAAGVRRNLKEPFRFLCMVDTQRGRDTIEGVDYCPIPDGVKYLMDSKGCFVRLLMFDQSWQFMREISKGDRIVCMDLDTVVTGDLDPLFLRPDTFSILKGANAVNPCPFNGSLMMLRAGYHREVWGEFSIEKAGQVPFYEFPDDQGWIWHKLPDAGTWNVGPQSGVYAFQKPGWPKGDNLPSDARLVVFPGWRSPHKFTHVPWINKFWRK